MISAASSSIISSLAITKDDKYLYTGGFRQLKKWLISDQSLLSDHHGSHNGLVSHIKICNDDRFLFTISEAKLSQYYMKQNSLMKMVFLDPEDYHEIREGSIQICPNNQYIFVIYDSIIFQYLLVNLKKIKIYYFADTIYQVLYCENISKKSVELLFSGFDYDTEEDQRQSYKLEKRIKSDAEKGTKRSMNQSLSILLKNYPYMFFNDRRSVKQIHFSKKKLMKDFGFIHKNYYVNCSIISKDHKYLFTVGEDWSLKQWNIKRQLLIKSFYRISNGHIIALFLN